MRAATRPCARSSVMLMGSRRWTRRRSSSWSQVGFRRASGTPTRAHVGRRHGGPRHGLRRASGWRDPRGWTHPIRSDHRRRWKTAPRAVMGLEVVAGSTRGRSSRRGGDPSDAFQRIAREIAALLPAQRRRAPADRDGRTHKIKVVGRAAGTSRSARAGSSSRPTARSRQRPMTPEEQVASVLRAPMAATGLPLRVATYSLRAPTAGQGPRPRGHGHRPRRERPARRRRSAIPCCRPRARRSRTRSIRRRRS